MFSASLKIDQSFIRRVAHDYSDAAITQAIISLGHILNLTVVAEGVFARQQLDFLRIHACDEVQGNYFREAVPLEQLRRFFDRQAV